jgi:hypothetical protein
MTFRRYSRGAILAYVIDAGGIDLRRQDGISLLATIDGVPRSVIAARELHDVAIILDCIDKGCDQEACELLGVGVLV